MKRIIDPLTHMGAKIRSTYGNGCAPLEIDSSELHGINYVSPIASAQVQSAVLFAGLYATGDTTISEPFLSRDHTRIMLNHFEANVRHSSTADKATGQARYSTTISPVEEIYGRTVCVPGDISSAAFFIAAALLVPGSVLQIENVGVNPTRDGLLRVLETMGADITILDYNDNNGEPTATIYVRYSKLHGTTISGALIPALIDELPIIAVLAATAVGTTIIKDAAELKVKESNRIHTVVTNLTALGANVTETDDGMVIEGVDQLSGGTIGSFMDHRIAMAFAIGGLAAREPVRILNSQCVDISFPTFFKSRIFK
jgi:3-phosphoshikimate 1-carboxyvinyltransferase